MNRRSNFKIKPSIIFSFLIILGVLSISLGYSSFHTIMEIDNISAMVRINRDIRITNVSVDEVKNSAVSMYEEYDEHQLSFNAKLPNSNSSVTYRVEVANFGNVVCGILDIKGLPNNLTYEIKDYSLKNKLCDSSNNCSTGMKKEFLIVIKYKSGAFDASKVDHNINLDIEFSPFYTVNYNADGGSVSPLRKDVMYKNVYGELPVPSKVGHTFNSWQLYGEDIKSTTIMDTPSDHTLIAKWDVNLYDVQINSSNASVSSSTLKVPYGGYKEFTVTPSNGFHLKNISCDGGYTVGSYTSGSSATETQTIRINNNSKTNGSTCTIETESSNFSCTWSDISYVRTNETANVTLTCNSVNGFKSTTLSTSNFTSSNVNIGKITAVSLSSSTATQAVYNVTIRGIAHGTFDLSLNQNSLYDNNNKGNTKFEKSAITVVGFDVNSTSVSLNLSGTKTFQIQVVGGNYGTVTYSVNNSNVSVSDTGLITALATGTSVVTVTEGNYGLTRTINVSVSNNLVVNYELTYLKSSNTATSISSGSTYSTKLSPTNTLLYGRPDSISVYVDGTLLASSKYTYNSVDGSLSISNVKGDLRIVAVAEVLSDENISFEKPKVLSGTGTIDSVAVTQSYQLRIFEFVPTVTRSYTIQSFDSNATAKTIDPYLYLFEETPTTTRAILDEAAEVYAVDGTYSNLQSLSIAYNDDGGDGFNFKITHTLEAGKRYFFAIRTYTPNKIQTFVNIKIS